MVSALNPPGTTAERARARLSAARMVLRQGGGAADLVLVLDALALWPESDPD